MSRVETGDGIRPGQGGGLDPIELTGGLGMRSVRALSI